MQSTGTLSLCLVIAAFVSASCATGAFGEDVRVQGESLILAGDTPGNLCFDQVVPGSLTIRSTFESGNPAAATYEEGKDYVVDYDAGTVARTADSSIPDFSTNVLYGQKEFDHTKFPGYGNKPFFVWVDYETRHGFPLVEPSDQAGCLAKTRKHLEQGGPFKLLIYGDSISVGGEASEERLQFGQRYADSLRERFPKADITVENGATGGDATSQGLQRLEEKVLTRKPDLVLLGFGMNDHNKHSVEPAQFEENLVTIVNAIHERTGAEVLIHSTFPPNPDWVHSSHRMELYAAASRRAAERTNSAYADVYGVYEKVLRRKDPPSILANNINHPNDYGHWLYLQALEAVKF